MFSCTLSPAVLDSLKMLSSFPMVALFLVCILWGNRMLRREHFKKGQITVAFFYNIPPMIMFSLAIAIGVRFVGWGLQ